MAINFNTEPYYDDYDEDKGFYRILFKPGVSVQARELTQLQTIIQKQIDRHGSHIFKEGARVTGGEFGFTNKFYAVRLQPGAGNQLVGDYLDQFVDLEVRGQTSGVTARVVMVTEATAEDPHTLYVTYTSTGDDRVSSTFANDEKLIAVDSVVNGIAPGSTIAQVMSTNGTAIGASASMERGVYFVNGHFVLVPSQRIILSKYTNTPSVRVGLGIYESVVDADDDQSLLDTAQNAPNFSARGADRLRIELRLETRDEEDEEDENFIELERIRNGFLGAKVKTSEYSELETNLARRTYDESGDYVIKSFQMKIKETLNDGLNNGVYFEGITTDDGNDPSDDFMTLQLSAGKAYVRGYEVTLNQPAFIDIPKPREFQVQENASINMELGNYVRVNNVFGSPETSSPSTDLSAFKDVLLYDEATTTPGEASGAPIGVARARAFELENANQGGAVDVFGSDASFRLYLFDIKMFTEIVTTSVFEDPAVSTHLQGTMVRGDESRAFGYLHKTTDPSNQRLLLTSVVGTFRPGEDLRVAADNYQSVFATALSSGQEETVINYALENVKQVYSEGTTQGLTGEDYNFSADLQLEGSFQLTGSANVSGNTITGLNAFFSDEVKVGDALLLPTGSGGASEIRYVSIVSNNEITLQSAVSNARTSITIYRLRALINEQEKNLLLRRFEKDFTRSVDSVDVTRVYRQFVADSNQSGQVIINAGSGQSFVGLDNDTFTVTIVKEGTGGSGLVGQVVNVESDEVSTTSSGSQITIASPTIFGNGATVKVLATINKSNQAAKAKLFRPCSIVQVLNKSSDTSGEIIYGTSSHHRDISLGVADATKILAVYASNSISEAPAIPTLTLNNTSGTFSKGEIIRGGTSGATGIIVDSVSPIRYVSQNAINFQVGETITGFDSGATSEVVLVAAGSVDVSKDFLLDTGQRDNFYDVSKITRKVKARIPKGQLAVVFDYFEHSSGDFFTVDSYSSIEYKDIPTYSATRVDPEVRSPSGRYDLRSSIDFRPRVANIQYTFSTSSGLNGARIVTGPSFDFESRKYSGDGASRADTPVDNSSINYNYSFYLGRNDAVFMTTKGELIVIHGIPSEDPKVPEDIDNAMRLANIDMPPYVLNVEDVDVTKSMQRRYTMKDIGKLERRINNIEYYTSLSLLEKSAEVLQIKDANGLDRFKSGFLVDNFGGHKTGDVLNRDYRCAIDMTERVLRPKYKMKNIALEEVSTTPEDRLDKHYTVSDNIALLPYEAVESIEQPYATRVENLNPVLNFSWAGSLKLEPSADEWFEIERLPDIVNNVEGNFNTVLADNKNAIGTVWNAPITEWTGVLQNTQTTTRRENRFINLGQPRGRAVLTRTTADEVGVQTRTGMETTVVEQIDVNSEGDRVVAEALIPYIRSRDVLFEGRGLKPFTRVYPFFDKVNVGAYVTPTSGSLISKEGVETTVPISQDWERIKVIEVHYDNNSNKEIDIVMARTYDPKRPASWNSGVEVIKKFSIHNHGFSTRWNGKNDGIIRAVVNEFPDAFASVTEDGRFYRIVLNSNYRFTSFTGDKGWRWIESNTVRLHRTSASSGRNYMQYMDASGNWVSLTTTHAHPTLELGVNNSWGVDSEANQASNAFYARSVTRTTNRSIAQFDFTDAPLKPNQFGQGIFRFRFYDRNGNGALASFQISEITFYDENYNFNPPGVAAEDVYEWNIENALISNVDHSEVIAAYNMKKVDQLINGGKRYDSDKGTWVIDGINYRSDHEIWSEALVGDYKKGECGVDLMVRGGVRTAEVPDNNLERFAAPGTQSGDALVTDAGGFVSGIFEIPDPNIAGNPIFETGERLFRLTSDPQNGDESVETFAQAPYTAKGILRSMQETFTATRNGVLSTREVTQETTVTRQRDLGEEVTGWWDPLAQSIMPSTPGGEFITGIDVFFATKDDFIPVTCQLREMENGVPTRKVIPFGSKTLQAEDVSTSEDGSVPTYFEFDAPVFVKENVELCIVLMTDSQKYLAWISRMGEKDVLGNRTVSEQPYLGVLFKSQNNSTWTAYDYEDLKFTVYRAQFDTSKNGIIELQNSEIPMAKLGANPLEITEGSSEILVNHDDHGMYDTSQSTGNVVVIDGVKTGMAGRLTEILEVGTNSFVIDGAIEAGFPTDTGVERTFIIRTNVDVEADDMVIKGTVSVSGNVYTVNVTSTITASHPMGAYIEFYELGNLKLDLVNNVPHKVTKATIDSYVIDIGDEWAADITDSIGGSEVVASHNALINDYQLMVPVVTFPGTEVRTKVDFLNGTSPSGTEVSFGNYGETTTELVERIATRRAGMIASGPNEFANNSGLKSMKVTFEMNSTVDNLSPIVDLERKSMTTYANRIDYIKGSEDTGALEYNPPTDPDGDSGEAIYITKRVQLKNPATSIKVILDAVRNPSAEIEVMYKVLRSDDSNDFDEIGWSYFNGNGSPDIPVPAVSDRFSYREYEYTQDNISEFIAFAIKIKMNGTSITEVPKIKDLRAIALAL